jgi:hypothetical protein
MLINKILTLLCDEKNITSLAMAGSVFAQRNRRLALCKDGETTSSSRFSGIISVTTPSSHHTRE